MCGSVRSLASLEIGSGRPPEGDEMSGTSAGTISKAERDEILNAIVADYARDGWTITSVFAGQAVVQKKERLGSNNFWVGGAFWALVILLVIFTAGLWLIVIAFWYLTLKTQTVIIRVDERGAVDLS
jgi:hypothetical protein